MNSIYTHRLSSSGLRYSLGCAAQAPLLTGANALPELETQWVYAHHSSRFYSEQRDLLDF